MSKIKRIEGARTKDELEAIGRELGVELDKRKTMPVLREELLALVERDGEGEGGDAEPNTNPPQEEPQEPAKGYAGKLVQNTRNGRILPWTAALAGKKHIKEL